MASCNSYLLWVIAPFSKSEYHLPSWSMHPDWSVIRFTGDKPTGCGDDGCTGCVPASFEPGALPKYGNAVDTCFPIVSFPPQIWNCVMWARAVHLALRIGLGGLCSIFYPLCYSNMLKIVPIMLIIMPKICLLCSNYAHYFRKEQTCMFKYWNRVAVHRPL